MQSSVSSYVEKEDTRKPIDIEAVNKQLQKLVPEGVRLRKQVEDIIKSL